MVPGLSVRVCLAVLMLLLGASSASAQPADIPSRELLRLLQQPLEMKDFQQSMTLKECIFSLTQKMSEAGKELPILVNSATFRMENPDAPDTSDSTVKFQPYPKRMTFGAALKMAVDQIPTNNAVYIVRQGRIEITTAEATKIERLLEQRIAARLEGVSFAAALQELSEQSGLSIILDPRAHEKTTKTTVTATFRNDVTLEGALRILCEMADMRFVNLREGVFVTTPENANRLLKELKEKAPRETSATP